MGDKMRKILILVILFLTVLVFGQRAQAANPDPNRVTVFNKLTDKIATINEDPQDAREIIQDRQRQRRQARQQAIKRAQKKESRKRMLKQQQIIMDKINSPYTN